MAQAIRQNAYGVMLTADGIKRRWCSLPPRMRGRENTPQNVKRLVQRARCEMQSRIDVQWGYQGSYIDTLTDGRIVVVNVYAVLNDRTIPRDA